MYFSCGKSINSINLKQFKIFNETCVSKIKYKFTQCNFTCVWDSRWWVKMLAADVHSHCQGSEEITVEEEFHAFHFVHKRVHTLEVDIK